MSATDEQNPGKKHDRPQGEAAHKPRGTAAMTPETRQEVARKGGLAVSRNKQHMAEIGRKGGVAVSKNKQHMAEIGRKGGEASRKGRARPEREIAPGVSPGLTTQPQAAGRKPGEEEAV